MDEQLQAILANLSDTSVWGIKRASQYLGDIIPCLHGGELCPTQVFGQQGAKAWMKSIKEAESRLVYSDPGMTIGKKDCGCFSSEEDATDVEDVKGAVLVYDAVLSAKTMDRDGDILDQMGLRVDPKMALLWQHIQVQPIGKLVKVLNQSEHATTARFAIADVPMGRDAATLVEFGALRKSHGFKPIEARPRDTKMMDDGTEMILGWHIAKSMCLEGSLVSIPSNSSASILAIYKKEFDGVCTAMGRNLLEDDLVKHWAKGIYDMRPTQVPGADLSTKDKVVNNSKPKTGAAADSDAAAKPDGEDRNPSKDKPSKTDDVVQGITLSDEAANRVQDILSQLDEELNVTGKPGEGVEGDANAGVPDKGAGDIATKDVVVNHPMISQANRAKVRELLDQLDAELNTEGKPNEGVDCDDNPGMQSDNVTPKPANKPGKTGETGDVVSKREFTDMQDLILQLNDAELRAIADYIEENWDGELIPKGENPVEIVAKIATKAYSGDEECRQAVEAAVRAHEGWAMVEEVSSWSKYLE